MMKHITGKAALFALSMVSASAFASHWGYEGEGSPEHWGELDEAYKTCQSGMNQSPINIDSTANAHLSPLQTHYIDGPVTLTNNGHTIQASEQADTRDLRQFGAQPRNDGLPALAALPQWLQVDEHEAAACP